MHPALKSAKLQARARARKAYHPTVASLMAALDAARRMAVYSTVQGRMLDATHLWLRTEGRGLPPTGEWWGHVLACVRACAFLSPGPEVLALLAPWTGAASGATFSVYAPTYDTAPAGEPQGPPSEG